MPVQSRYGTLDALRGIAALGVVVFHLGQMELAPEVLPHGYLAVDFFFVLSGFIVAHAYEKALRGPLTFWSFALRRAIRLYPLAVLGVVFGTALLLLKWCLYPGKVDALPVILLSSAVNSLLLPMPFGGEVSHHVLFPGNGPLWSLFFELVVNLAWGACGVRLRTGALLVIVIAAGVGVAGLSWQAGTANLGFDTATAFAGAARVSFGFPLGVVLFRSMALVEGRSPSWFNRGGGAIPGILLLAIFAMPDSASPLFFTAWDIASILVLLPLLVAFGSVQGDGSRLGNFLGELSYPIYALHFPVLLFFSGLRQSILIHLPIPVITAAAAISAIATALLASRFYDIPLRAWLSRRARDHAGKRKELLSSGEAPI